MQSPEGKERVLLLAEKVKLLLTFSADLIPDLELLEESESGAGRKANDTLSAAPIFGAMGVRLRRS